VSSTSTRVERIAGDGGGRAGMPRPTWNDQMLAVAIIFTITTVCCAIPPVSSDRGPLAVDGDTNARQSAMSYFRITLLRSSIGLPKQASGVLKALGLRKRMKTVYHPVSQQVAGQIFAVKELLDVQEVDQKFSPEELKELRRPDSGFYVESRVQDQRMD
jgi:large subunit ribosomal protein L30